MLASGPGPGGQGFTSSHSCDWQQVLHVCFSPVSSAALICSLSFPVFSVVPLFFFSVSPTFSLHADKFLCFTSPKTPSSSWMSHLSDLCSLSVLQLTLILSFHILP